jgi:hypothetical protein
MLRTVLIFIFIIFPAYAENTPDFHALKKSWGNLDSVKISRSADEKHIVKVRKGDMELSRDLYMLSPKIPELLLWFFHGYKPDSDPYKQSPEILIKNLELKELSSWYNALIVIIDSGTSLYAYNPDQGLPEIQIYCGIYDKITKLYGILPAIIAGISSGAEGAVKFAPFVKKLNSLICISGSYDYDSLPVDSNEYKIHLKEFGSAEDWKYEQPVRIFQTLKCSIFLLSEEKSIYRSQAEIVMRIPRIKKIKFLKEIGKGKSHDWDFWGSAGVKKVIYREVQAAGENYIP